MISWQSFTTLKPDWAVAGERLLIPDDCGIGFLATVAKDGRPRMAPVCPIFSNGDIYLSVASQTAKEFDLINDGRYVLHALLGKDDEEFQMSGKVQIIASSTQRSQIQQSISFEFNETHMICELQLNRALWAYWIDAGQPGTRVNKQSWRSEGITLPRAIHPAS